MRIADVLAEARRTGQASVVPYLLVDRARASRLEETVAAYRDAGATALELGFPFSDPLADGPVLALAAGRALAHGTRWSDLLAAGRRASPILPTAVMTYANPVWRRGLDVAMQELASSGASGLVVPDLALEESGPWRRAARAHGLDLVLLAAPGVAPERLERIARASRGFLYVVGHYGTTGAATRGSSVDLAPILRRARTAAPRLPVLVGFGIRDRETARNAIRQGADGLVVATALEERLGAGRSPAGAASVLRGIAALSARGR